MFLRTTRENYIIRLLLALLFVFRNVEMKSELAFLVELLMLQKNICAESAQVFMKKTKHDQTHYLEKWQEFGFDIDY